MIALIECIFMHDVDDSTNVHITYNFGRMTAQVISGIGFLGAGTIFMNSDRKIGGLTTAASGSGTQPVSALQPGTAITG